MIQPTELTLWEVPGNTGQSVRAQRTADLGYIACHYPRRQPRQWGTLWDKIDASEDGCWPWIGSRSTTGYGAVWTDGRATKAHRAAYEALHGPTDARVLHVCDNPPCCNPAHLFAGSPSDNSRDMVAKGRGPRGVEPRLTDEDVRRIRSLRRAGWTLARIATLFGCHEVTVCNIANGKRRADVPDREEVAA